MNFHSSGQPNPEPEKNSKPNEQATGEQQADAKLRKGGVFESPVNEAVEVKSSNTFAAGNYQPDLAAEVYSKTPLRNTPQPENRRENAGTASTTDTGAAKPDGRSTASAMVDTKRDTGVKQQTEVSLPTSAIPAKDGARAVVLAQGESQTQFTRGGPQGGEGLPSGAVKLTDTRMVPSDAKVNPSEVKSIPTEIRPNSTEVKSIPTESRVNHVVTEGGSGTRPATAQTIEPTPLNKGAATIQSDRTGGDNAGGRKDESVPGSVTIRPAVTEASGTNITSNAARNEVKSENKSIAEGSTLAAGGQFRSEQRVEQASTFPNAAQQKSDAQTTPGQSKIDPPKGSDLFSTQGTTIASNRQDGLKAPDAKVEAGRPPEQASAKEPSKDFKAGTFSETIGQRGADQITRGIEIGPKEPFKDWKPGGVSEAVGQKAEQITKGIETRVNESVKQAGTTDGAFVGAKQPSSDTGGKSQGITDGAQSGIKQPNAGDNSGSNTNAGKQPSSAEGTSTSASSNIRQPMADAGDKGSSGGGSSAAADSTKKFDSGITQGGKSEGQSGSSGMGGGSSAPIDRAPHAPFRVEDGQPSGVKGEGGIKGDLGAKGDAPIGGKGESAVSGGKVAGDGSRFDTGEVRGNQPGTRFDSGEVRGTQPGTRFDAGEIKDTRGGIPTGGKSSGADTAGGSDSSIVKGTDVSGTKAVGAAFLPPGRKDEAVPA